MVGEVEGEVVGEGSECVERQDRHSLGAGGFLLPWLSFPRCRKTLMSELSGVDASECDGRAWPG